MIRRMCCWPTRYTRSKRVAFILFQMLTACKRTFRCFVRAVAWIPVIFVSAVIIWGYYVYVYVMNISGKSTHCFKVVDYTNCMFPIFLPGAFPKGSPTVSALVSGWKVYANQYSHSCDHIQSMVNSQIGSEISLMSIVRSQCEMDAKTRSGWSGQRSTTKNQHN